MEASLAWVDRYHGAIGSRSNTTSPTVRRPGNWLVCEGYDLALNDAELAVTIPDRYHGMLEREPGLALAWRMTTRDIFTTCFANGYQVAGFSFEPDGAGTYLLRRDPAGA